MADAPTPDPVFRAELIRLKDADTIVVSLDRWLGDKSTKVLRLLGCDAYETRGPERGAGLRAREWAEDWLISPLGVPYALVVQTTVYDSFGRVLANVFREHDGASMAEDLIAAGHGVAVSVIAQMKGSE